MQRVVSEPPRAPGYYKTAARLISASGYSVHSQPLSIPEGIFSIRNLKKLHEFLTVFIVKLSMYWGNEIKEDRTGQKKRGWEGGNKPLGRSGSDRRIILKRILKKYDERYEVCEFTSGCNRLSKTHNETLGVYDMQGLCWLSQQILASQEGLRPMQQVASNTRMSPTTACHSGQQLHLHTTNLFVLTLHCLFQITTNSLLI